MLKLPKQPQGVSITGKVIDFCRSTNTGQAPSVRKPDCGDVTDVTHLYKNRRSIKLKKKNRR